MAPPLARNNFVFDQALCGIPIRLPGLPLSCPDLKTSGPPTGSGPLVSGTCSKNKLSKMERLKNETQEQGVFSSARQKTLHLSAEFLAKKRENTS